VAARSPATTGASPICRRATAATGRPHSKRGSRPRSVPGMADFTPEQMQAAVASLSSPDIVESPFGELHFFDGVPPNESIATIYDALDLIRGIDVFLNCVPGASLVAMRRGFRAIGLDGTKIGYTDPRANSGSFFLTPNTETTYGSLYLDLKAWG